MPRIAAFFDMDKTLIDENSGSLYLKQRYARGEIKGLDLARGFGAYLRYKLGLLDLDAWTRELVRELEGQPVAAVEREVETWLAGELIAHLYPEAKALVEAHRQRGHLLAIVSGAPRFVVAPLARYLAVENVLPTELEERDGRFTGRVIPPVCFGAGKIHWLRQLLAEHDVDLARSAFYTDSITDLPLLELVGRPVAVNPDPRLYREASRRRWPVRLFTSRSRD